jgi:hypothetical protein
MTPQKEGFERSRGEENRWNASDKVIPAGERHWLWSPLKALPDRVEEVRTAGTRPCADER